MGVPDIVVNRAVTGTVPLELASTDAVPATLLPAATRPTSMRVDGQPLLDLGFEEAAGRVRPVVVGGEDPPAEARVFRTVIGKPHLAGDTPVVTSAARPDLDLVRQDRVQLVLLRADELPHGVLPAPPAAARRAGERGSRGHFRVVGSASRSV